MGPRIDIPSSKREQRGQREQTPTNERQQRCQRDQISLKLGHNSPRQAVGSRCRSEGLTYEYTSLEKWIFKLIGHKWRDYKCLLKGKGYGDDTDINTLYDNCPDDDVDYDQWVSLVNFWRSEEGKRRSNHIKESLEKDKVKPIHTTGTKSLAHVREDMKKSSNKSPTQTQVYLKCLNHESEADITNQRKNVATEQGNQELDLDDDPVSKVLGKDKYGRVCGLGLGVKPSDVGDPSYPWFCNGLNMSTDNEAVVIHYFRHLEGAVQQLRNRVKRQGITITKVKRKLRDHDISLSDESKSDTDIFSLNLIRRQRQNMII
ncbi:hypothetical protein RDABS01_009522, partial [Bienertia sinuspersici]